MHELVHRAVRLWDGLSSPVSAEAALETQQWTIRGEETRTDPGPECASVGRRVQYGERRQASRLRCRTAATGNALGDASATASDAMRPKHDQASSRDEKQVIHSSSTP